MKFSTEINCSFIQCRQNHSSSASLGLFSLLTHVGFGKHCGVPEIFSVEIFCFLSLGVAGVADDGKAKSLVRNFLLSEHLLEPGGQVVEFRAVCEVRLQDSGAHLNIFDVPEQTSVQVLLEAVGRDGRLLCPVCRFKEVVALVLQLVVYRNRVLDVVAARRVLVVRQDASVRGGRELVGAYCFETFVGASLGAAGDLLRETHGGVVCVGGGENVLTLDARNKAGVAGQALVADFVRRAIHPRLRLLTLVSNHCMELGKLPIIVH